MENWLKCQISPLVKYRHNKNKTQTVSEADDLPMTAPHRYEMVK